MDIVTSLIISNKLQFEEGEIKLLGTNICLIPPEVYLFLYSELESRGQTDIFYETSKESSYNWLTNLAKASHKVTVNELLDFLPKILDLLAYGRAVLVKKDLDNVYFEFELESPLYPELSGKSDHPIDLSFAGLLAGSLSAILKKNMICIEKECVAQGFGKCIFVVREGDK